MDWEVEDRRYGNICEELCDAGNCINELDDLVRGCFCKRFYLRNQYGNCVPFTECNNPDYYK